MRKSRSTQAEEIDAGGESKRYTMDASADVYTYVLGCCFPVERPYPGVVGIYECPYEVYLVTPYVAFH